MLASGDPGFFGIVRALRARGIRAARHPGRLLGRRSPSPGSAWTGTTPWWSRRTAATPGRRWPPRSRTPRPPSSPRPGTARDLAEALLAAGKRVYVAERLGTPQEQVSDLAAEPSTDFAEPNVLIALDPEAPSTPRWLAGHQGAPDGWALPEDAFEHRDSMITKAEVRALVLARLGPAPGRTIWDVGAGSGSVAVECARFGARVIAVEADPAQCDRIRAQRRHAPRPPARSTRAARREALIGLPPADAVFAGGGDHAVLAAAIRQANPDRVVVTLAAVQRVGETADLLTGPGLPGRRRPAPGVPPRPPARRPTVHPPGRPEPRLRPLGPAMIGLVSVTAAGQAAAERLAKAWPDARRYDGPAAEALPRAFNGMRRRRLLPRRRRDRPADRPAADEQARRPRRGLRRRGAALRGPGARRAPRRRQRAGPPGRRNPGRRTGRHHRQRRRRGRRAGRVRRRPGLHHRAGQRPGRRGRRDPVRRPGHRSAAEPGMAAAAAAPQRRAHRPPGTRRPRRRGDRPDDRYARTGCGLPPPVPACRRGREPGRARRGDRPAHRRHAGGTGAYHPGPFGTSRRRR